MFQMVNIETNVMLFIKKLQVQAERSQLSTFLFEYYLYLTMVRVELSSSICIPATSMIAGMFGLTPCSVK